MTTVQLFQDKDLLGFLQAQIKPTDHDPWLFVYIPETVSYAVRQRFADILQPDGTIMLGEGNAELDYDSRMTAALERFAGAEEFAQCRLVSGHFKVFQIDAVPALSRARLLTVLRDPVDRLLSDFSVQNAANPERLTPETFLEFAKSPGNLNVFLQFLCPKRM